MSEKNGDFNHQTKHTKETSLQQQKYTCGAYCKTGVQAIWRNRVKGSNKPDASIETLLLVVKQSCYLSHYPSSESVPASTPPQHYVHIFFTLLAWEFWRMNTATTASLQILQHCRRLLYSSRWHLMAESSSWQDVHKTISQLPIYNDLGF